MQLAPADIAAARRVLEAAGLRVSTDPADLLRVEGAAGGAQVARLLAGAGVYPEGLVHRRDSLEDVFLRLTDHRDEPIQ